MQCGKDRCVGYIGDKRVWGCELRVCTGDRCIEDICLVRVSDHQSRITEQGRAGQVRCVYIRLLKLMRLWVDRDIKVKKLTNIYN